MELCGTRDDVRAIKGGRFAFGATAPFPLPHRRVGSRLFVCVQCVCFLVYIEVCALRVAPLGETLRRPTKDGRGAFFLLFLSRGVCRRRRRGRRRLRRVIIPRTTKSQSLPPRSQGALLLRRTRVSLSRRLGMSRELREFALFLSSARGVPCSSDFHDVTVCSCSCFIFLFSGISASCGEKK